MSEQIHKLLEDFITECREPFSFDELLQHLNDNMPGSREISYDALCLMMELNFPVFQASEDLWVPAHIYFKNAKFLMSPTAREIKDGILVPGHRCIPFHNPGVFPQAITLRDEGKKAIPKESWGSYTFGESLIYYSLFGPDNTVFLLINDNQNNEAPLSSEDELNARITQRVFKMKDFYTQHGFQEGDFIECTCRDYEKAVFDIRYLPPAEAAKRNTEQWVNTLDACFDSVFSCSNGIKDTWKQMGEAFFEAGKDFLKKPALHFGGYLKVSDTTGISMPGGRTILWYKDEEPDPRDFAGFDGPAFTGECYSLDAILQDIGISFTQKHVEAYIRDALFQKKTTPEYVVERCFTGRDMEFATEEQKDAFFSYITELWNTISKNYNIFADQERGKLRRRVLLMLDSITSYLRELDKRGVDPADIPFEMMQITGQISAQLENYAELLENEELTSKLQKETNKMLDQIERIIDHLKESIEAAFDK